MPNIVKLLFPDNLNSTYLRDNFINNGDTYVIARTSPIINQDQNTQTLTFGIELLDFTNHLPVTLKTINSISISNDPFFDPSDTVQIINWPCASDADTGFYDGTLDYILTLNPSYFFTTTGSLELLRTTQSKAGSFGVFIIRNWPLSANGGIPSVYLNINVSDLDGVPGTYPGGYELYAQILWQSESPSPPGIPNLISPLTGWSNRHTKWQFHASEEPSTGLYNSGISRYQADIIELRIPLSENFSDYGLYKTVETFAATIGATLLSNPFTLNSYIYNSVTNTYTTSADLLTVLTPGYGVTWSTIQPIILSSQRPDFLTQVRTNFESINSGTNYFIELSAGTILRSSGISGIDEVTVRIYIPATGIPKARITRYTDGAAWNNAYVEIDLPFAIINQLVGDGVIELYIEQAKASVDGLMIVSAYFTPILNDTPLTFSSTSILLGSTVAPAFATMLTGNTSLYTNFNAWITGNSANFIRGQITSAPGKIILDADLGNCNKDEISTSGFPTTYTTGASWLTTNDWLPYLEPNNLEICSVESTINSVSLIANVVQTENSRAYAEIEAQSPTFSDRVSITLTLKHTSGDVYVALSSNPVITNNVDIPTVISRPMGTRVDGVMGLYTSEPLNKPTLAVVFSKSEGSIFAIQRNIDNTMQRWYLSAYTPNNTTTTAGFVSETWNITVSANKVTGNSDSTSIVLTNSYTTTVTSIPVQLGTQFIARTLPTASNGMGWYITTGVRSDRFTSLSNVNSSDIQPQAGLAQIFSVVINPLPPSTQAYLLDAPSIRHFLKGTSGNIVSKNLLGQKLLTGSMDQAGFLYSAINNNVIYMQQITITDLGLPWLNFVNPALLELQVQNSYSGSVPPALQIAFLSSDNGVPVDSGPINWISAIPLTNNPKTNLGTILPDNNLVQFALDVLDSTVLIEFNTPFWILINLPQGCNLAAANAPNLGQSVELFSYSTDDDYFPGVQLDVNGNPIPGTGWQSISCLWFKLFHKYVQRHDNISHLAVLSARVRADSQALWGSDASMMSEATKVDLLPPTAFPINGLRGDYYIGGDFNTWSFTREDSVLNFNSDVDSSLNANDWSGLNQTSPFSVIWRGNICPTISAIYTISVVSNGGTSMYFNGVLEFNNFGTSGNFSESFTIPLISGINYPIVINYYQNGVPPSNITLSWSTSLLSNEIIPTANLNSIDSIDIPSITTAQVPVVRTVSLNISAQDVNSNIMAFRIVKETDSGIVSNYSWQPWSIFSNVSNSNLVQYNTYLYGTSAQLGGSVFGLNTAFAPSIYGPDTYIGLQDIGYDGSRKVWVQVMDQVGNISESYPVTVLAQSLALVDTNPPTGTIQFINTSGNYTTSYNSTIPQIIIGENTIPVGQIAINTNDRVTGVKDIRVRTIGVNNWTENPWFTPSSSISYNLVQPNTLLGAQDGLYRVEAQLRDYGNNASQLAPIWNDLYDGYDRGLLFLNMAQITGNSLLYISAIQQQEFSSLTLVDSLDPVLGPGIAFYAVSSATGMNGRRITLRTTDIVSVTINGIPYYQWTPIATPPCSGAPNGQNNFWIDTSSGRIVLCIQLSGLVTSSMVSVQRTTAQIYSWDGSKIIKVLDMGYYGEKVILSMLPITFNSNNYLLLGGGSGAIWQFDGTILQGPLYVTQVSNIAVPVSTLWSHQFHHEVEPFIYAGTGQTPRLFRVTLSQYNVSTSWNLVSTSPTVIPSGASNYLTSSVGDITCMNSAFDCMFIGTSSGLILRYERYKIHTNDASDNEKLTISTLLNKNLGSLDTNILPIACLLPINQQIFAGIGDRPEIWNYTQTWGDLPLLEQWSKQDFNTTFINDSAPWQLYATGYSTSARLLTTGSSPILSTLTINDPTVEAGIRQIMEITVPSTLSANGVVIWTANTGSDWEEAISIANTVSVNNSIPVSWMAEFEVACLNSILNYTGRQGIQFSDGRYFLDVNFTDTNITLTSGNNTINLDFSNYTSKNSNPNINLLARSFSISEPEITNLQETPDFNIKFLNKDLYLTRCSCSAKEATASTSLQFVGNLAFYNSETTTVVIILKQTLPRGMWIEITNPAGQDSILRESSNSCTILPMANCMLPLQIVADSTTPPGQYKITLSANAIQNINGENIALNSEDTLNVVLEVTEKK